MRRVRRFGKKGKLSPRFMRPFEILERIGQVLYNLVFPPALARVHNVFHVSMLRRYIADESHVLSYSDLVFDSIYHMRSDPSRFWTGRINSLGKRQ